MAQQTQEQDINQLIKVRRDKLKELQENGKDPFQITKYDVTNHSTDIKDDFDAFDIVERFDRTIPISAENFLSEITGIFCSRS